MAELQKDRQLTENLHTIEQIKAAGNKIFTNKGDEGLHTARGNTHTLWVEKEPGLYYPYHSYERNYP